jgi:hypothetical protein
VLSWKERFNIIKSGTVGISVMYTKAGFDNIRMSPPDVFDHTEERNKTDDNNDNELEFV